MSLSFRGTEIAAATFNGTVLDKIIFNGTEVWSGKVYLMKNGVIDSSLLTVTEFTHRDATVFGYTVDLGGCSSKKLTNLTLSGEEDEGEDWILKGYEIAQNIPIPTGKTKLIVKGNFSYFENDNGSQLYYYTKTTSYRGGDKVKIGTGGNGLELVINLSEITLGYVRMAFLINIPNYRAKIQLTDMWFE